MCERRESDEYWSGYENMKSPHQVANMAEMGGFLFIEEILDGTIENTSEGLEVLSLYGNPFVVAVFKNCI